MRTLVISKHRFLAAFLVLLAVSGSAAVAAAPNQTSPADRISVYPSQIDLSSRRDCRQLVVTGWFGSEQRDLTHDAAFRVVKPGVVTMDRATVRPAGDGTTTLIIDAGGRRAAIPVRTSNIRSPDPINFKFETMAVLTKQGCSTGSCHGSPHGKGGFQLSLFGYAPEKDRVALTRDGFNRRIDVMEPADSLMIKKPMLQLPHVGGKRLHKDDAAYNILCWWIAEGAHVELPAKQCTGISVYPNGECTLTPRSSSQQISVLASFSDGTVRDVTSIAAFDTSSAASVTVSPSGLVIGHGRGQAAVSVRYLDKLESVHFTMVEPIRGFVQNWKDVPGANYVDLLVNAKLKQLQYVPSAVCSDSVFVRRLYLDLTGLLPTSYQTRAFLSESQPHKRADLIDNLLNSEEYARYWALQRADLMRVSPSRLKGGRAERFSNWIVDAVRSNMPYDRFAKSIITAVGDSEKVAPANYFVAIPTMEERTEMTAELFMGSRVECAHCHNHPFENWTQRDYYSIGAVFARTKADNGVVSLASSGESTNPTSGEVLLPFGAPAGPASADQSLDRRSTFADWLVKPGNPFFAKVAVNRIWAALMGKGIVDPIDDFRSSNPPSNGPLIDRLARDFEASGYDCKQMIRLICSSNTYQRTGQSNTMNASDQALFSHARVRLLGAEQLKDALGMATHSLPPTGVDRTKYATERAYPEASAFTLAFGQPERTTSCACERQSSPTLVQALELLNGPIPYRLASESARYYAPMQDLQLVDELYLSALCRFPSNEEKSKALTFLKQAGDRLTHITDLVWTITNTREFLFQH